MRVQCFVLPISSILVQKHTTRVLFEAQPARAINNADTKLSLPGNLLAGQHDTKKKRTPPSQPIEVRFPLLQPPEPSTSGPPSSWTSDRDSGISAHFLGLKRPSDVTVATIPVQRCTITSATKRLVGSTRTHRSLDVLRICSHITQQW
jgi:hypothetical protein